jgi:hypothetical protein
VRKYFAPWLFFCRRVPHCRGCVDEHLQCDQERPYHSDSTASRPLCEVKHCRARLVLRWGTTLESRVLFFCRNTVRLCAGYFTVTVAATHAMPQPEKEQSIPKPRQHQKKSQSLSQSERPQMACMIRSPSASQIHRSTDPIPAATKRTILRSKKHGQVAANPTMFVTSINGTCLSDLEFRDALHCILRCIFDIAEHHPTSPLIVKVVELNSSYSIAHSRPGVQQRRIPVETLPPELSSPL